MKCAQRYWGLFSFKTDLKMRTADEILDEELSDNMLEYLKGEQVFREWIKDAMYKYADEYHKCEVLKLNKPHVIKSVCESFVVRHNYKQDATCERCGKFPWEHSQTVL